jgi:putative membrane protein (TIGR04086 family)
MSATPPQRSHRFSWGIALSSGAIAVGVSAFLETLLRNLAGPADAASLGTFALSGAAVAAANMLGGYLAARRAKNRPLLHALVAGAICIAFFVVMMMAPANQPAPEWFVLLMLVVPMAASVCGARLARARGA